MENKMENTLENELEKFLIICPICTKTYNNTIQCPLVLGCGHTLCSECLIKSSKNDINCPFCKLKHYKFPSKNYAILQIIDYFKTQFPNLEPKGDEEIKAANLLSSNKNFLLAEKLRTQFRFSEAIDLYKIAISEDCKTRFCRHAIIKLVDVTKRIKRLDILKDFFTCLLLNDKDNPYFLVGLALYYSEVKDFKKYLELCEKAFELDNQNSFACNNIGNAYFELKQEGKALEFDFKTMEIDPNNSIPYNNIGFMYYLQNKEELAELYYQRGINLNPNNELCMANLGLLYFNQEKFELSQIQFQKSLNIEKTTRTLKLLGDLYLFQGKNETALKTYIEALEISPDDYYTLLAIGKLYKTKREDENAIKYFQKSIEQSPKEIEPYHEMGSLYFDMKKFALSIENFKKIIELKSEESSGYINLGKAYTELGLEKKNTNKENKK